MLNRANRKHCFCNGVLFRVCKYFFKLTRYKLIIASQSRGECKTKDNGKRWCYVDKGSCKDERKGRSSGMYWSFEACRKGQTVRLRPHCAGTHFRTKLMSRNIGSSQKNGLMWGFRNFFRVHFWGFYDFCLVAWPFLVQSSNFGCRAKIDFTSDFIL